MLYYLFNEHHLMMQIVTVYNADVYFKQKFQYVLSTDVTKENFIIFIYGFYYTYYCFFYILFFLLYLFKLSESKINKFNHYYTYSYY